MKDMKNQNVNEVKMTQREVLPGGGFFGGEQKETLPDGGFHGGEQKEMLPGGGFHGGEQKETLPGGGFHGVFCQVKIPGSCQIKSLVLPRYFTRMRAFLRR